MYTGRMGGLGQGPEDAMRAAEVGKLLTQTAQDIQTGLNAARALADASLVKVGQSIQEDWKLAQHMAIDWKDYAAALRSLGFIQTAIGNWFSRLREKGANVQFRGIYTPPLSTPTIFGTLSQTAKEAASSLSTVGGFPSWLLPVGAGVLLFLLLRR